MRNTPRIIIKRKGQRFHTDAVPPFIFNISTNEFEAFSSFSCPTGIWTELLSVRCDEWPRSIAAYCLQLFQVAPLASWQYRLQVTSWFRSQQMYKCDRNKAHYTKQRRPHPWHCVKSDSLMSRRREINILGTLMRMFQTLASGSSIYLMKLETGHCFLQSKPTNKISQGLLFTQVEHLP